MDEDDSLREGHTRTFSFLFKKDPLLWCKWTNVSVGCYILSGKKLSINFASKPDILHQEHNHLYSLRMKVMPPTKTLGLVSTGQTGKALDTPRHHCNNSTVAPLGLTAQSLQPWRYDGWSPGRVLEESMEVLLWDHWCAVSPSVPGTPEGTWVKFHLNHTITLVTSLKMCPGWTTWWISVLHKRSKTFNKITLKCEIFCTKGQTRS